MICVAFSWHDDCCLNVISSYIVFSSLCSPQPLPPVPSEDAPPPTVPRKPNFPPSWPCKLTLSQWPWPQRLILPKDFKIARFLLKWPCTSIVDLWGGIFFSCWCLTFFFFAFLKTWHWLLSNADLSTEVLKLRMTWIYDLERPTAKDVIVAWGSWSMKTCAQNFNFFFFLCCFFPFTFAILHGGLLWKSTDWKLNASGSDEYFFSCMCVQWMFVFLYYWRVHYADEDFMGCSLSLIII